MQKILIITGGSKGIGSGIIKAFQKQNFKIHSISRSQNPDYDKEIRQWSCDLSDVVAAQNTLIKLFDTLKTDELEKIVLINNAGTLGDIGALESLDAADIQRTVQLNTTAPLVFTSTFLKHFEKQSFQKLVVNISSGAAKTPYFGWSIYCATKAALDMMVRVVALEQSQKEHPTKIITVYPGVVDTDMQGQIRSASKENFSDLDKFLDYKSSGALADAEAVGEKIFRISDDKNLEDGAMVDVRQFA